MLPLSNMLTTEHKYTNVVLTESEIGIINTPDKLVICFNLNCVNNLTSQTFLN